MFMPDRLYRIAVAEGIGVHIAPLPEPLLGLYDSRPGETPMIILHDSNRDNRKLLRCILAEEIGHHFTCAMDMMAFAMVECYIYSKYDRLALWWAVNYLVPFQQFLDAIRSGHKTVHALAEHFDVTEHFMTTTLKLYKAKKKACCSLWANF